MNLPENLLQKLETEEDLNSAMAEAQFLMAVTAGPAAATAAPATEESTTEVVPAEAPEYIAAIEAAMEAINAVDDPNAMVISTNESESANDTEAAQAPVGPTETQQPSDIPAESPLDLAMVRAERRATIFQEVLQNQAASLEEFRAAHTPVAAGGRETEYTVDTNLVEALDVVLQEHQQDIQGNDATIEHYEDCLDEINTSDEKEKAVGQGEPANEEEQSSSEEGSDDEDNES